MSKQNEEEKMQASRRTFLKGSILAGAVAGAAGLGGAQSVLAQTPAPCQEDWETAPELIPDSKISKTVTVDVVVIGSALSGLSATRAALEGGAKVAVIEKSKGIVYRSSDVGVLNSSIQKKLGVTYDAAEVVTTIQDYYHNRTSADLWRHWAENSGAALDWWLSLVPNYKLVDESAVIPEDTTDVYVRMPHWPHPKAYDAAKEHYKIYSVVHQILPDMGNALTAVYDKCVAMGAQFSFSTRACQLTRPNKQGRVTGVIAQDKAGNYIKYVANKSVVLCTGDYSNDRAMLKKYCTAAADIYPHSIYPNKDAWHKPANTGDGHKMGMWIGAQMEHGPHAPVSHSVGGPLGDDAFLLVNVRGQRFMNEDNDGQNFTNAIERQPKMQAFQIFDTNWPDQLSNQGISHGDLSALSKANAASFGNGGWTSVAYENKVMGMAKKADTLEDLARQLGLPVDNFVATVKRYNELARAGKDTDYYKRADRMYPILKAPFYGGPTGQALLVVMGGLVVTKDCQVCDNDFEPIPGLFAAGNAMGCRFSADYAMSVAGVSHGTALTFGRLAGEQAAKA
ncbi:FAD-dependent oxidoreductase [Telmatobacter bradus]|uniref:FAD-dependent oxidoreductase n=1 Tax=Telmatobacter bradus TaxID=474953 RepID=UPI003B4286DF